MKYIEFVNNDGRTVVIPIQSICHMTIKTHKELTEKMTLFGASLSLKETGKWCLIITTADGYEGKLIRNTEKECYELLEKIMQDKDPSISAKIEILESIRQEFTTGIPKGDYRAMVIIDRAINNLKSETQGDHQ